MNKIWLLGIFICLIYMPIYAQSEEASNVSFKISKRIGTDLGHRIEGKFTIKGTGTEDISELHLYFGNVEVYQVNASEMVFDFNTNDFPTGKVNITLVGITETGQNVQITEEWEFISPDNDNNQK